jgi:16S rRNA (adenine1518-N6/adenine1519-N6)-dimethyltransferase
MSIRRTKKRLGQHFLSDPSILGRIADAVEAGPSDTVVEIGPGPGGLTAELAGRAGRVIAIEKDRDLARALDGRWPNVTVIAADALEADWHRLAGIAMDAPGPVAGFRIAGNIPYNITSPLIDKALAPPRPALVAFLLQREVADRLAAPPGSSAYGALSVGVQACATVERVLRVGAGAFAPPPRVDSAVIRLRPSATPLVADAAVAGFRRLVVGLFGFRRKQLLRGLRELTGWSSDRCAVVLARAEVDPSARPETLTPTAFAALHAALVDAGWAVD